MGLDISYYKNASVVEIEAADEDTQLRIFNLAGFEDRSAPFTEGQVVEAQFIDDFCAGSYGGYNLWRNELARLAGYESADAVWRDPKPGPFVELINFADNEGYIGPIAARKLAGEFDAFQAKADTFSDQWFRDRYADWRKAFEAASENGLVEFH